MPWLEALFGLQCDGRFAEYLFQCTLGSIQERTLLCILVSGSSWQPCPDREELLDELALGEAKPNGAVVLRPWRTMNLTFLRTFVFWWRPGKIRSSTSSSQRVRREAILTTIG